MNSFEKFVIYIRNSYMSDMFHSDYQLNSEDIADIENHYDIKAEEIFIRNDTEKLIIFTVIDNKKQMKFRFIISTVAFLFGKNLKKFREQIVNEYGIEGVVTLKKLFFQHSTIPMAVVLLGNSKGETWFTSAASTDDLEVIILDIKNYSRKVNYTKNVDPDNLMPEFYKNDVDEITSKLDNCDTKKLYEIADIISGKTAKKEEFAPEGIQYLRARNLVEGRIKPAEDLVGKEYMPKFAKQIIQEGDILLSKYFGEHRLAIVTADDLPAVVSNSLLIIRATDVPEGYLYQYFTSNTGQEIFKAQLDRIVKGYTINSINLSDLEEIRVPIYDMQTMTELSDINKLQFKQARELSEKLDGRISGTQIEQMVIGQFIQAGWGSNELLFNNREYAINLKNKKWIPDIILIDNGEVMAIVEVKSSIFKVEKGWIELIKEAVQSIEAKLLVLTTGLFYEVYITGTVRHQRYSSAPTKAELRELLEREVL